MIDDVVPLRGETGTAVCRPVAALLSMEDNGNAGSSGSLEAARDLDESGKPVHLVKFTSGGWGHAECFSISCTC